MEQRWGDRSSIDRQARLVPCRWRATRRAATAVALLLLLSGCSMQSLTGPVVHARYPSPPPGGMGPGSQVLPVMSTAVPNAAPPSERPAAPTRSVGGPVVPSPAPRVTATPDVALDRQVAPPAGRAPASPAPTSGAAQPAWLTTTRATPLLSGAHDPAVTFGTVPAGTRLELAAPPSGERLLIRNPANGGIAYVDAASVTTGEAPSAPAVAVAAHPTAALQGTYRVRPGETLYRIARRYHLAVDVLARANGISDPRQVRAGQLLRLPATDGTSAAR